MNEKQKAKVIIKTLNKIYPKAPVPLKSKNTFTLLISVLLSAQCTDVNVNNVTKDIYPKYYKPEHFVKITIKKNEIQIIGNKKIKNMKIKTAPYPGFPTDLQAQIMVLLCKANKSSIIEENIFENRFMHVAELNRMGAKILTKGNKALVEGNISFAPAELMATDLRASVSLILAALSAKGKSIINRIYHLDRGYENIEKKLKKIGAKIRRVN